MKHPYLPLYTGDWLKDPAVTLCATATRGVWIDLLCAMHELNRSGELRGTAEQLSRIARCSTVELVQALTDLQTTGAAEVVERNGAYIVRNRRMYAEAIARKSNADRQKRFREQSSNGDVTPGVTRKCPFEDEDDNEDLLFEQFWESFPRGRRKDKARARKDFAKAAKKVPPELLVQFSAEYAESDEGRGQYVKMPSTWLNGECWNDDREAWKDREKAAKAAQRRKGFV